jgi:hypothetical protein
MENDKWLKQSECGAFQNNRFGIKIGKENEKDESFKQYY